MKWKTILPLMLAGGAVLGALALVTTSEHEDAAGFYAAYQRRAQTRSLPRDERLSALELAGQLAKDEGQQALERTILTERSSLLLELGAYARARSDFQRLQELGELSIEQQRARIRLELAAGEFEAAQQLATEFMSAHAQDGAGRALLGQSERALADAAEQRALQLVDDELVDSESAKAQIYVRDLCGRELTDPRRVARIGELRTLLGPRAEPLAAEVLDLCERSSRLHANALISYGWSLSREFRSEQLAPVVALLTAAGQRDRALDLCTLGWSQPGVREQAALAELWLRELAETERWRLGNLVAAEWMEPGRSGTLALYSTAARIAYGSLDNPDAEPIRLFNAGNRLAEILPVGISRLPLLYTGTAFHRFGTRENREIARFQLSRYLSEDEPEPFPLAHASAYRAWAECCRDLGLSGEERTALEGAVALDPTGNGADWLRLAELERSNPHGGLRLPDERLARAITLLPQQAQALIEQWKRQGEAQLKITGFDETEVRTRLKAGQRPEISFESSPYELFRLAEIAFEEGASARAEEFLRALLERVPRFPPALDLSIAIATQRNRRADLLPALLARVEQGGIDAGLRARIAALPPELLDGRIRRRLCLADPEGFGRLAMAQAARHRGDRLEALQTLRSVPAEWLQIQGQLEIAGLELEVGSAAAALERLEPLTAEWLPLPGAFELYARAALTAGNPAALEAQLPKFVREIPPEAARAQSMLREWVARGAARPALLLCIALERAGQPFRGKQLLLQRAACEAALGDEKALTATLERLEAAETQGQAELLRVFSRHASLDQQAWSAGLQAARSAGWKPGPLTQAALASTQPTAAASQPSPAAAGPQQSLLAQLLEPQAEDSVGSFRALAGARGLALVLSALEEPLLVPQADALLARVQAAGDLRWSGLLRTQLLLRGGFEAAARGELEALLQRDPACVLAWEQLERLSGSQQPSVRARRLKVAGADALTPTEQAATRAAEAWERNDAGAALEAARAGLALQPGETACLEWEARALGALGDPAASATAWLALCRAKTPPVGSRTLGWAVQSLASDRAALEQLLRVQPADPRLVLALAELDLREPGLAPAFATARAIERLQRFRSTHTGSLESMAAGSTEQWARFLLRLDPMRAQELLDHELDSEPGNIAAWTLLAHVRAERGELGLALRDIVTLQRMSPSAALLMEYLRVRSQGDWTPEGVRLLAQRIAAAPDAPPRAKVVVLEAQALLRLGPSALPQLRALHGEIDALSVSGLSDEERALLLWTRLCASEAPAPEVLTALSRLLTSERDRTVLGIVAGMLRARSQ